MAEPIVSPFLNPGTSDENSKLIHYKQAVGDYGHFIVYRVVPDGRNEIIGHIYTEIDGEETRYITTNQVGREIFPPTTEFNSIDLKFERYARLINIEKSNPESNEKAKSNNYSPTKKSITMTTNNNTPQKSKTNQLVFVEYEKPTKDGHFITIVDSYRNNIGRIYKNYNEELKKFEYTAFDHEGNLLSKNEKVWTLKNEFINNREQLLEQAHLRRIALNEEKNQTPEKENNPLKPKEKQVGAKMKQEHKNVEEYRLAKTEKYSPTSPDKVTQNENTQEVREQELEDLRNEQENESREFDL